MKKKILFFTTLFITTFSLFCAELEVAINPGEQWKKRDPQLAVWIEDQEGNYISTIYVTKGASKKAWKFSPKEGRPDSLPIWYNASKINPATASVNEAENTDKALSTQIDAVTSATPKNGIVTNVKINLQKGKTYFIKAEVNQSFDYNNYFTKKNSSVNGQPSVVYQTQFTYTDNTPEVTLKFIGTGSIDGSDGKTHTEQNQNLTTAKEILDSIYVVIK